MYLNDEFRQFIYESITRRNRLILPRPTVDDISRAISYRNYVGIYYEDESDEVLNGFRLIEPYVFGFGYSFGGSDILYPNRGYLRAFVIKSSKEENLPFIRTSVSLSNRENGWRLFRYDRISDWFMFRYKFSSYRDGYNEDDKMIGNIITSADKNEFSRGVKSAMYG